MCSVKRMRKLFELLIACIFFHWKLPPSNAGNMNSVQIDHSTMIDGMTVKMLMNCYSDFKTIVVYGNFDPAIITSGAESRFLNVIMVNNMSTITVAIEHRTTMSLFLMTPDSDKQFHEMLLTFKHSLLWNIMNPLFILSKSTSGCENARDILRSAWKMNVVKSFFLCVDSNRAPTIYTYNPYTDRAPHPWKKVLNTQKQADRWTMYFQTHYKGGCCEAMNFDRTKYLDGSVVRVVTTLPEHHTWIPDKDYNESLIEKMYEFDALVAKAMKFAFNATLVFNVDEPDYNLGSNSEGFYRRLRNGSSDIALCLRSAYSNRNFTTTYTVVRSKYYIATNNRGFYTPWEKIKNYYGLVTLISMSIILLITFIVIVLSGKKRRWSFAGFEILRLIVNTAIHTRLNTSSRRIYFFVIFLYFLIIHATFHGHLSAFLTKDEYRKNVESLEDLKDSRYNVVHIARGAIPIIEDPLLKAKILEGHPNCSTKIVGKPFEACIADIHFLHHVAFEQKLHLSEKSVSPSEYSFAVRNDWPLKERVDIFLMRLEQSGIIRQWSESDLKQEETRQQRIIAMTEVHFRPISLPMLEFAHVIFAIGLTLSIACFLLEQIMRGLVPLKKKIKRVTRKIVNVRR